jgi:hypothetical protein
MLIVARLDVDACVQNLAAAVEAGEDAVRQQELRTQVARAESLVVYVEAVQRLEALERQVFTAKRTKSGGASFLSKTHRQVSKVRVKLGQWSRMCVDAVLFPSQLDGLATVPG